MSRGCPNGWCVATMDHCTFIRSLRPYVWTSTNHNSWLTLKLADRIASTHVIHWQSTITRTRSCLQLNVLFCLCSDNSFSCRSGSATQHTQNQSEREDEGCHRERKEEDQCRPSSNCMRRASHDTADEQDSRNQQYGARSQS
jgi:hypothetical protein